MFSFWSVEETDRGMAKYMYKFNKIIIKNLSINGIYFLQKSYTILKTKYIKPPVF